MAYRVLSSQSLDPACWDSFVAAQSAAHVLQCSRWGALKAQFGWRVERVAVEEADHIVAGAQLLFRRLPWGQTLAYVPKGPLVQWSDAALVTALLDAIAVAARGHRAVALKIEPELLDDSQTAARLADHGFRPGHTVQPRSTIVVDLSEDPQTILAGMKSKWRYNVRLSERKGVTVREAGESELTTVQRLMAQTAQRDGFSVHSGDYYAAAHRLFSPGRPPSILATTANIDQARDGKALSRGLVLDPGGEAVWLVAEYEGQLLAAIVVFALGDVAWYFWGASSDEQRHLMPNHALQWAAMLWAQERGCRRYDLWGIPDEVGADPSQYEEADRWGTGGLWGVYRFKQGFGGRVERTIGAWDRVYQPLGYRLYQAAVALRRRID